MTAKIEIIYLLIDMYIIMINSRKNYLVNVTPDCLISRSNKSLATV